MACERHWSSSSTEGREKQNTDSGEIEERELRKATLQREEHRRMLSTVLINTKAMNTQMLGTC